MSEIHSKGDRYLVIDNVLPPQDVDLIRQDHDKAPLRPTLSAINPFHDGLCFTAPGPTGLLHEQPPTGESNSIHELATQAADALAENAALQHICTQWAYTTFYSAYPIGTKLSWHDDGANRIGAFIYYLGEWSSDWGGELDVIDCPATDIPTIGSLADSVAAAPQNVTSIFPKDNRLVVLRASTVHRIRRVDQLAGTHVRQAISGFITDAEPSDHR